MDENSTQPYLWSDLELRHLVALQTIASAGSFWAASEVLDCSASALSQQIAQLERLVGHRLVERSRGRRHVRLTEPGQLLVRHADAIVARMRAAHADLISWQQGERGSLRIGTYQSVATKVLPQLLRRFAARWPGIGLHLDEELTDEVLLDLVERGALDLTFTVLPLPEGPFDALELMRDPYALLVSRDAPLAAQADAALPDLAGLSLIGQSNSRAQDAADGYLRAGGVSPSYVFRSNDNGVVQALVGAGIGAALLPRLSVDERDPAIQVLDVPDLPPRRLALAWHRDRHQSPAALAFIRLAQEVCAAFDPAAANTHGSDHRKGA